MTYSNDLRKKALDYVEETGSKIEASHIFGITVRTLFNWIKRKKQGCLAPNRSRNKRPHKIKEEQLKAYIQQYPDAYLRGIAELFKTSITAVFYACKRYRIILKKRHPSIRKEMRKNDKYL